MKFAFNASLARRAAYAALAAGALLIALAACALAAWFPAGLSAASQSRDAANFWPDTFQTISQASLACGGWLLVFGGLLLAGRQAARSRMFDALKQLLDEESSAGQSEARGQIAEASARLNTEANVYAAARQYLSKLRSQKDRSKYETFNAARRRLGQFWFRVAKLVELGLVTEDEALDSFDPAILELLEPFETIAAEDAGELSPPKPWPALKFYIAWLKRRGEPRAAEWQATLPARQKLYRESKAGSEKQAG